MKLIHCSDIRLNASLETSLDTEKSEARNSEILLTFVRMVRYAARNLADAVLITGNLFVPGDIPEKTLHIVKDCIVSNPGIDFLYISGRFGRDKFTEAMRPFPQNFKPLRETHETLRYGDHVVISAPVHPDEAELSEDDLNIVMHYGLIDTGEWEDLNIDYLALGGSAELKEGALGDRGRFCYPGTLEGRYFSECGPKGFIRLDITDDALEPVFVQAAKRELFTIEVDAWGAGGFALNEKIDKAVLDAEVSDSDLLELKLTGRAFEKAEIDEIRNIYSDRFFGLKIDAEVKEKKKQQIFIKPLRIVREDIRGGIREEFAKAVDGLEESEEDKEEIRRIGLAALGGDPL